MQRGLYVRQQIRFGNTLVYLILQAGAGAEVVFGGVPVELNKSPDSPHTVFSPATLESTHRGEPIRVLLCSWPLDGPFIPRIVKILLSRILSD